MKALFTTLALCATLAMQGQIAVIQAEFNNFRWMTSVNGSMFYDFPNAMAGMEVPIYSNRKALFAANLWIAGMNEEDSLHLTAETFCQSPGCQIGPGPLKLDGTLGSWTLANSPYNRFWYVSKWQVETHTAYHDCLNDPDCNVQTLFPNGYTTPPSFVTWPAMGNSSDGFATYLAPFFDYNGDGVYDANSGDHPIFCGDMAVYSISNDLFSRPAPTQWAPGLGVEIHSLYYAFSSSQPEIFNTIFVQKRIINRSSTTYSNVYVGVWNDFDLGNYNDDYIGTDVQRSMVYVYNGDDFDEPSSAGPGYGDDLPMLGMRILRGPLKDANGLDDAPLSPDYTSYGNQTTGWGDGIADNERLGLATSMYQSNTGQGAPPVTTDPVVPAEYYNYMLAAWKDGTPQTFGGIGYDEDVTPPETKYVYPGDSDPLMLGTNGIDPSYPDPAGWSEVSNNNPPGDRRILASSGPFTFGPGQEQVLDYAYIFARDSHEPGVDVLETLRSYADAIVGMECGPLPQILTSVRDVKPQTLGFELFPNPARSHVVLQSAKDQSGHFVLFDLLGKAVLQGVTNGTRTEIAVGHLPKGLYLIRYEVGGEAAVRKLVVE